MLGWALIFFIIAMIAAAFGFAVLQLQQQALQRYYSSYF